MRVLIGFNEIAGYYAGMRDALRGAGVQADFVDLSPHPFGYGAPDRPNVFIRALVRMRERRNGYLPIPGVRVPRRFLYRMLELPALVLAVWRYDVIVFGFRSSFGLRRLVQFDDLRILKALGKRLVFVFNGDDVRPAYLGGAIVLGDPPPAAAELAKRTRDKREEIAYIERHADTIISHPPFSQLLTRPFVVFHRVGLPMGAPPRGAHPAPEEVGVVRILHAPSRRASKGSDRIRAIVGRLAGRGLPVELVEIHGLPNAAVMAAIADCDFVVDQCYGDVPMAGFAAEAAMLGKGAVVGGYAGETLREYLPDALIPPTVYRRPEDLEAAIETLVRDPEARRALGRDCRAFVAAHYTLDVFARNLVEVLEGRAPSDWYYDPARLRYVHGSGMPEAVASAAVAGVIAHGGVAALEVEDKPELEARLAAFATGANRDGALDTGGARA